MFLETFFDYSVIHECFVRLQLVSSGYWWYMIHFKIFISVTKSFRTRLHPSSQVGSFGYFQLNLIPGVEVWSSWKLCESGKLTDAITELLRELSSDLICWVLCWQLRTCRAWWGVVKLPHVQLVRERPGSLWWVFSAVDTDDKSCGHLTGILDRKGGFIVGYADCMEGVWQKAQLFR